jgi:hypothetical protein
MESALSSRCTPSSSVKPRAWSIGDVRAKMARARPERRCAGRV